MALRLLVILLAVCTVPACGRRGEPSPGVVPSFVRTERRGYLGAPPVIPHRPRQEACVKCHTAKPLEVADFGLAPVNPHLHDKGLSEASRCVQCHVFRTTNAVFVANSFRGRGSE